jgi:hypothetical protein
LVVSGHAVIAAELEALIRYHARPQRRGACGKSVGINLDGSILIAANVIVNGRSGTHGNGRNRNAVRTAAKTPDRPHAHRPERARDISQAINIMCLSIRQLTRT